MTEAIFDSASTPRTREFQDGETYEWPDIPYLTQARGCLRMTLCRGNWAYETYRGHPCPVSFDDLGPVVQNMMLANRCFHVLTKTVVNRTRKLMRRGDKYEGGRVIGGDFEQRHVRWDDYGLDGKLEVTESVIRPGKKVEIEYQEQIV